VLRPPSAPPGATSGTWPPARNALKTHPERPPERPRNGLERLLGVRSLFGKPRRPGKFRRLFASVAVIGLAVVGAVGVGQAAYAAAPVPIHTFNDSSGLCLQPVPLNGASIYDNGIPIWQMPCNGSQEQNWKKLEVPNGQTQSCWAFIFLPIGRCGFDPVFHVYYLVNQLTLSCLDITDARTADHTPIQQWSCNNGGSEKWWLPPSDQAVGQYYPFSNFRTGNCLDVPAATNQPNPMQEYHCTSNNNAQVFAVPPS
jgi:ricin-type beta-trefoil lectin protein